MKSSALISILIISSLCGLTRTVIGQGLPPDCVQADQLFEQGRYHDAIQAYQSVLSFPSHTISPGILHTRIADSYYRLADYGRAHDAYRTALMYQKPVERAQTQYWIGFCALLLGRYEESVAAFLKITEQHPSSGMWVGTAYYWAGRASERMGKKEQAAEFYRKAGGKGLSTQERFAMKKAKAVKAK